MVISYCMHGALKEDNILERILIATRFTIDVDDPYCQRYVLSPVTILMSMILPDTRKKFFFKSLDIFYIYKSRPVF